MGFNPFKSIDRALDKGSNALQRAASTVRNEFNDTTRTVRRTTSSAVNTVRREIGETRQTVSRTARNAINTTRREIGETRQTVSRTARNAINTTRREIGETRQTVSRTARNAINTTRREIGETRQTVSRTARNTINTTRREIGETRQTVSRTARNVANTARQVNLSDVGHTVLDAAGFIPVVGGVADLANAGWYAAKGDKVNAALSAASAIPFAGDAFAAGKLGLKAAKGAEKLAEAGNAVRKTTDFADEGVEGVAKGKKYTFDTQNIGAKPGKTLNSHQRRKTWKAMADNPEAPLTEVQRQQIRDTPWYKSPTPMWKNPVTGKTERMELSHEGKSFSRKVEEGSSRRGGGTEVVPRWPETHADIDDHRHLARNVREAYTSPDGIDKIRKAFAEEVKEWGYKVDDSKL